MAWGRALEAPDESLALLHATGLIAQALLLLFLLNLFLTRSCGIPQVMEHHRQEGQ